MRSEQFFILMYLKWYWYVPILLGVAVLFYLSLRRKILSIIDPLFFAVITTIFANTVPVFLYASDEIDASTFIYFVLSSLSFWLPFLLIKRSKGECVLHKQYLIKYDSIIASDVFIFCLITWLGCTILTYALSGVPIFMDSRLETYASGGGIGLLGRLRSPCSVYCLLYSIYAIRTHYKRKTLVKIFILLWIISAILSGSKSSILPLLFMYFFYTKYIRQTDIRIPKKYLFLAVVGALCVVMIQSNGNILLSTVSILQRFVASGDIYWEAYPEDLQESLVVNNPFIYLLQGLLGGLRLIDYQDHRIGLNLGYQVHNIVYPELIGVLKGPNSRVPFLSYVLFDWGGIIFSFVLGLFTSLLLFRANKYLPSGVIGTAMFAIIYMNACSFITDPVLGFSNLFDSIIGIILLIIFSYLSIFIRMPYDKRFSYNGLI